MSCCCSTPVVSLLLRRGPPAVTGLIVAIVVDAVDREVRRRLRPHVFNEAIEPDLPVFAVAPAITNSDSPCPIVLEFVVAWLIAPSEHLFPRLVERVFVAPGVAAPAQILPYRSRLSTAPY